MINQQQRAPTKMPTAIFLDSGGVINDNELRTPQWVRYLGEFLPTTVLGGTPEIWGYANTEIGNTFFARWGEYMTQAIETAAAAQADATKVQNDTIDYITMGEDRSLNVYWIFERIQLLAWIKAMIDVAAEAVPGLVENVLPSLTDNDLFALARSAHLYTLPKVKADFPGAVDTIRMLGRSLDQAQDKKRPFKLYTSSGDSIEDLEYILGGLGVLECFDGLYGSDRINCLKKSPLYYERVFRHVGIRVKQRDVTTKGEEEEEGEEVVVVDDSLKALKWARSQGARTVLISDKKDLDLSQEGYKHIDYHLKALSDLPALLESWRVQLEP
ncbi:hypothetical protein BGZ83_006260 [Gryganskiella cystojenkinii]|nr:hypothetical protein BGZ83_006260 [Gryganskiella cystojenkinii]